MAKKLYFVLLMIITGAAQAGEPLTCPPAAQVIISSVMQGVVQFIPPQHTILKDGEEDAQSNFRRFNKGALEGQIKPEHVLNIDTSERIEDRFDDNGNKYLAYVCSYNMHYKKPGTSGNIFVQIKYAPGK